MKVIRNTLIAAIWLGLFFVIIYFEPDERRVDCQLSEFHPDFTEEMKRRCRELRRHKL